MQASSRALAFTGVGGVAQWLAVAGGALIIVGFVLLAMVDTPAPAHVPTGAHSPLSRRRATASRSARQPAPGVAVLGSSVNAARRPPTAPTP